MKIKLIVTGRGRIGLAFDWLMPYVTAGAALVNAQNDLIVTAAGVTGIFKPLTYTTLGWTAGAGFEVALSSNWSARLEYLHIRANDLNSTASIPNVLGIGAALGPGNRGRFRERRASRQYHACRLELQVRSSGRSWCT